MIVIDHLTVITSNKIKITDGTRDELLDKAHNIIPNAEKIKLNGDTLWSRPEEVVMGITDQTINAVISRYSSISSL